MSITTTYLVAVALLISVTLLSVVLALLCLCVYADRRRRRRLTTLSNSLEVASQQRRKRRSTAAVGGSDKTLLQQLGEERQRTAEYKNKLKAVERQSYNDLRIQILKEERAMNELRGASNSTSQITPEDDATQLMSNRNKNVTFTEQNADTAGRTKEEDAMTLHDATGQSAMPPPRRQSRIGAVIPTMSVSNEQLVPLSASFEPASVSANSTTGRQTPKPSKVQCTVPPFDTDNRPEVTAAESSLPPLSAHSLQIGSSE